MNQFFNRLGKVLRSRRFWTVQFLILLVLESVIILNFAFGERNLYTGFIDFTVQLALLTLLFILVNSLTIAYEFHCKNYWQFLGYLLLSYFVATVPCPFVLMILYSNFTIPNFINTEGNLIVLFSLLGIVTSFFYRFLYDPLLPVFKYPSDFSKSGKVMSVVTIVAAILCGGIIFCWTYAKANSDYFEKRLTKESEVSVSGFNPQEKNDSKVFPRSNFQPKHNEDISIYVDFSKSSAEKRFVVFDNKNKELLATSKCAHGAGRGSTIDTPVFSNEIGSNCSSLGEYRAAEIDKMENGFPCIRIDGLSPTNSNARKRGVVIHELPIFTGSIFEGMKIPLNEYISGGCFAISPEVFDLLTGLREQGKTMYIYATN